MNRKIQIILVFALIILQSCEKIGYKKDRWVTVTVKSGNHYSDGIRIDPMNGMANTVRFKASFNENCIYAKEYDLGWNKLGGASESLDPHKNSARFGWRPEYIDDIPTGRILIAAYIHDFGLYEKVHYAETVGAIYPNEEVEYRIRMNANDYDFEMKTEYGTTTKVLQHSILGRGFIYRLGFYIGGQQTLPNDASINLFVIE